MKGNLSKQNRIISLVFVLLPILSIYQCPGIPQISLADVAGVILAFISILSSRKYRITINSYVSFTMYLVLLSIILTGAIGEYSLGQTISRLLRLILYLLLFISVAKEHVDIDYFGEAYVKVCILASIYLFVQFGAKLFFNLSLPSTFTNLKIMYTNFTGNAYNSVLDRTYVYRPRGFFLEPAHFSRYILYGIPILMYKETKRKPVKIGLLSLAVLASQSAIGYIILASVGIAWAFFSRNTRNVRQTVFLILMFIVFIILSLRYGLLENVLWRTSGLNLEVASDSTVRISRGFVIYDNLPPLFKLIGTGLGNFDKFSQKFDIRTFFDMGTRVAVAQGDEYMSLISGTLVYGGVIGIVLFLYSLFSARRKGSKLQLYYYTIFILIGLSSNIKYYSPEFLLGMSFIYYLSNTNNQYD